MTNFAFDMFAKNTFKSAPSFCGAVNTAANNFSFVSFADTVFAVSVLLYSLRFDIGLPLNSLINMFIIVGIIFIKFICLEKQLLKSETL